MRNGAQAVILGCTEIGMLVSQADTDIKLLDTTIIHAKKAVEYAINEEPVSAVKNNIEAQSGNCTLVCKDSE